MDIKEKQTTAYIKMPDGAVIKTEVKHISINSYWGTVWANDDTSYSTHPSNIVVINE